MSLLRAAVLGLIECRMALSGVAIRLTRAGFKARGSRLA